MTSLIEQDAGASLLAITGDPDFFAKVRRLVGRIASCTAEIELADCLRDATAALGADAAYFLTWLREDRSFEAYRLIQACDPVWGLEYGRIEGYANDPWLEYALDHSEPARATEIACTDERQRRTLQLAETFGFRSAVVVPAPAGSALSRIGLLVLGSGQPGFFEADGYEALRVLVRAIAMELHECCAALLRRQLLEDRRLSDSEIALLHHERAGLSSKTIARLMGTTAGAVDARFHRLNVKLRCPNRRMAAMLAAEYGLVRAARSKPMQ